MVLFLFIVLVTIIIALVWAMLGFFIIQENERGVKVRLGNPYAVVESGWHWTPFLIDRILRYPTGLVELGGKANETNSALEFKRAGIFTKKGRSLDSGDNESYGPANIGADSSFRFFWPKDTVRLIAAVKNLPSPDDLEALTDVFEETVLEHVRTVGSQRIWVDLARDRKSFARDITASILSDPQGILDDVETPMVIINHLEIPVELLNTIQKQEVARLQKAATIINAEGEKERLSLEGEGNKAKKEKEGEGDAYARRKLFDAIGKEPDDLQKEILLTLREMAQGTSNTIVFPTRVGEILERTFGGSGNASGQFDLKKFINSLGPKNKKAFNNLLQNFAKGGGK